MEPIEKGPFQPSYESLKQYEYPEWFRDAKFGIWAHWSAQCVPEQGDWYARSMYEEGSADYNYHVKTYGHPSQFGFKDICNLWKAENWDPEKLIKLYKRAGAKYFVALANHHCNFDCWNSKYQPWNSVNIGPHKDIVGTWAKVARKNGLRFGVTVHCARSWDWYDVSHGSDSEGPMKGVPYDGNLTRADGKGKWWEGYDPADLYCPAGAARTPEAFEAYKVKWFNRTKDLVDKYHPDLLYFDDWMLPLDDAGLNIAAHYYNANTKWHRGKLEAVLNTKGLPPELRGTMVWDIERDTSSTLEPYPWQTDTCIGEWHYHRGIEYTQADSIIPMLVDIVSNNGNLLLNIPVRGDGTIDDQEVKILEDLATWMDVNGEGIFGTRPWKVSKEGGSIRFTTKGEVLYAFLLSWPMEGKVVIRSLAKQPGTEGRIAGVKLLGHKGGLKYAQDENGLMVNLPAQKPCDYAYALKIAVKGLSELEPVKPDITVRVESNGSADLKAEQAELHGGGIQVESRGGTWKAINLTAVRVKRSE